MKKTLIDRINDLYLNPVNEMEDALLAMIVEDASNGLSDFQRGYMDAQFSRLNGNMDPDDSEFGDELIEALRGLKAGD